MIDRCEFFGLFFDTITKSFDNLRRKDYDKEELNTYIDKEE